jgi:hypothetical protein
VPNLSRTYSRLRNDAGLPRDLVLYLARHECGTKVCRQKGIEFARRLLGHANISTTQRYMHLDDRELADAQDLVEYWLTVTALEHEVQPLVNLPASGTRDPCSAGSFDALCVPLSPSLQTNTTEFRIVQSVSTWSCPV